MVARILAGERYFEFENELNYNLRDCEKAFLNGKNLSEAQFRAAWDSALVNLVPKKGEHDAIK